MLDVCVCARVHACVCCTCECFIALGADIPEVAQACSSLSRGWKPFCPSHSLDTGFGIYLAELHPHKPKLPLSFFSQHTHTRAAVVPTLHQSYAFCPPLSAGVALTTSPLQGWHASLRSCSCSIVLFCVLTGPPGAAAGCQISEYPASRWAKRILWMSGAPRLPGSALPPALRRQQLGSAGTRGCTAALGAASPAHTFKLLIKVSLCLWPSSGPLESQ